MKKIFGIVIGLTFFVQMTMSQDLTQTIRGQIIDTDSKQPLIGVTIFMVGTNPPKGTTSDINGNFRITEVPVGRATLQLTYLGYETRTIPNLVVNSAKEVVLSLTMQESAIKMNEVVISGSQNDSDPVNKMALISARSISPEQTERFAGGFNDPSRILANFAGVTNTQDGSNDIIVRGNSPKYIQWRLEGVEITNPNHFADQNAISGGISALNNRLLTTSDFYTGAFTAEYGDVLSGVYDVKLRTGNNEKTEGAFGLGILGTDLTLEGPFSKNYSGSYLINYRYSTVSLIDKMGLVDIGGIPKFQDATIKLSLPTEKAGVFSVFGIGGLSGLTLEDIKPDLWELPGDRGLQAQIVEDIEKQTYLANVGVNHIINVDDRSFIKTSLSYSNNGIRDKIFESEIIDVADVNGHMREDTVNRTLNYSSLLNRATYRGTVKYSNKLNARNRIQLGFNYTLFDFKNEQSRLSDDLSSRISLTDFHENVGTFRNFIQWKYRINENIHIVSGLHSMNVLLNHKRTLEPRISGEWRFRKNVLTAGYGQHSTMESVHHYYTKIQRADGTYSEPNKNLDLLKAHHYVLGYSRQLSSNLNAKIELYYQYLYDLPVENNDSSYFSTINEGLDYRYVDLVNEGTGENYGIEFTLERYFVNNHYFMINGSLYESKYKALDGIERNTKFNGNYLVNVLCGQEFPNLGRKRNKTFGINTKLFYGGGQKYIPLLRDDAGNLAVDPENGTFWDYDNAYEDKLEDAFQLNISFSYKWNRVRTTHEIFMNLDNVTDHKGKLSEYYDEDEPNSIGYATQFGFFPNLMYRVYF